MRLDVSGQSPEAPWGHEAGGGVFPDHLELTVTGAPPLNVLYGDVGLKKSGFVGVGGRSRLESGGGPRGQVARSTGSCPSDAIR